MPYCLAFGCNSHSGRKTGENVSFHSFPKGTENLDIARIWYARCGTDLGVSVDKFNPEQFNKSKMFLCSKHFRNTDFETNTAENMGFRFRRQLKVGVTPTIFQWQTAPGKPNCTRKLTVSWAKKKEKQEETKIINNDMEYRETGGYTCRLPVAARPKTQKKTNKHKYNN